MAMCMRECQYLLKKEKRSSPVIIEDLELEDGEILETDNIIVEQPTLQRQSTTTHLNYIDETNKTTIAIAETQGWDAAVDHMLTKKDGTPRTYSAIRSLYG